MTHITLHSIKYGLFHSTHLLHSGYFFSKIPANHSAKIFHFLQVNPLDYPAFHKYGPDIPHLLSISPHALLYMPEFPHFSIVHVMQLRPHTNVFLPEASYFLHNTPDLILQILLIKIDSMHSYFAQHLNFG